MKSLCCIALLAGVMAGSPLLAQDQKEGSPEPRGIDRVDFTKEMTSVPELPSRYHCEQLVEAGNADQAAFDRCMKMEEVAYYELQETFLDFPAEARTMCGNTVLGMDTGYMGLRYCLKRSD